MLHYDKNNRYLVNKTAYYFYLISELLQRKLSGELTIFFAATGVMCFKSMLSLYCHLLHLNVSWCGFAIRAFQILDL